MTVADDKKELMDIISELKDKIKSMEDDKEKKCNQAKEQLLSQLAVTADKYRTATGVAEALNTIRNVRGNHEIKIIDELSDAHEIATNMSGITSKLHDKVDDTPCDKMDTVLDGLYNKDYVAIIGDVNCLSMELMILDLCRNVGPACGDMVAFIKRADQEIEDTKKELEDRTLELNGLK